MDSRVAVPSLSSRPYLRFLDAVVTQRLGDLPGRLVSLLGAASSPCTSASLAQRAGAAVSPPRCRAALKALLQHGFVAVVSAAGVNPPLYALQRDEIARHIRLPKYALYAGEKLGVEAEVVLEALAEHGRLTPDDLKALYRARRRAASSAVQPDSDLVAKDDVRIMNVLNTMTKQRYLLPVEPLAAASASADDDHVDKAKTTTAAAATEAPLGDDVLLRVNHERFLVDFRAELVVDFVTARVDDAAGVVARTMLTADARDLAARTHFLEMTLFDMLPDNADISRGDLRRILQEMQADNVPIVVTHETMERGETLCLDVDAVVGELRLKHAQTIVREKYGDEAARIFALLVEKKQLEEKMVANLALVSLKTAREKLYKMMRSHMVQLQELPRSADRNPQRTVFLWHVPLAHVYANLRSAFYLAYVNVQRRLHTETSAVQPLLDRIRENGGFSDDLFSERESKTWHNWQKFSDRLENAMLKIDDSIMVFRDF